MQVCHCRTDIVARPAEKSENRALQETLNDFGRKPEMGFEALRIDGDIGPKTRHVFDQVNAYAGPDKLTEGFGPMFGFLEE